MRRSFSGGSHPMPRSNTSSSTQFLRTVTKAVTNSSSTSTNPPSSSARTVRSVNSSPTVSSNSGAASPPMMMNLPISAVGNPIMNYYWPSFPSPPSSSVGDEEFEWLGDERSAVEEEEMGALGAAPSVEEVQAAVSSLQQVIDPASISRLVQYGYGSNIENSPSDSSSSGSEVDWMEPSAQMYGTRMLSSRGPSRVFDAFQLLQSDAAIQRMVVSLSSDEAVWNAVLNNEVVRELRGSLNPARDYIYASSVGRGSDGSNSATSLLSWIFDSTKLKVMEIVYVIHKIVNNLCQSLEPDKEPSAPSSPLEEKLTQSVMLTVMVLLVVVVTRANLA